MVILELLAGVIAGNVFGLTPQPPPDFVADFASMVPAFLAGTEVGVRMAEWCVCRPGLRQAPGPR